MKRRLLLIIGRSDVGGGTRHLRDLIGYINENCDFEFYVASPSGPPHGPYFRENCTAFFELPARAFSFGTVAALATFCRTHQIDLVHSHGRAAGYYSFLLKILLKCRVVHTIHGVHKAESYVGHAKNILDRLMLWGRDTVVFVSNSERAIAQKLGVNPADFVIIPNGVNVGEAVTPNGTGRGFRLGTLSRLDPHKNNLQFVEWFQNALEAFPDLKLTIAGDGEQMDVIRQHVHDHGIEGCVELLGEVSDTASLLSGLDLYVSFSKGEGLPYSILEAMAAKKPILVSDVPGHQHLLDPDNLFSLMDRSDFLNKLRTQLTSPLGVERNYHRVATDYNLATMAASILEVYRSW